MRQSFSGTNGRGRTIFTTLLVSSLAAGVMAVPVGRLFAAAEDGAKPETTAPTGDTVGTPWTGENGITESVEDIMARERREAATRGARPPRIKPVLRPDRRGLPQNPNSPAAPATQAPARERGVHDAGPFTPQTLGLTFNGVTGPAETAAFPPDTDGAAGPTQFIVAVNGRFRTFNKSTGTADGALDVDPDLFFASVTTPVGGSIIGNFTSDPHIRYDRLSGRWLIDMIDVPFTNDNPFTTAPNRVLLAVSSGSTISSMSSFTFFQFQHDTVAPAGDTGNFADYPTLGVDANALYIGVNLFDPANSFAGTTGFVVRKSSVLGMGPIVVTAFRHLINAITSEGPFTPQGVDNYDPAATQGYFIGVSNANFGELVVRRISTPGATPSISADILITVPATEFPITVPHLGNTGGTNGRLDALDDRLFAAHIRNGKLWTAHNIQVDTSGVASNMGGRDATRWYEIQNLTGVPSLVESGTVFDSAASNPKFFWIPSIMVSGQGHAALGFSTAGNTKRVNAGTVGRLVGDTLGTMEMAVDYTASSTAYNPPGDDGTANGSRRWGDFSYTSLDPTDDMTMWTIQEYCNGANTYGTQVVKLIAPPPVTPASSASSSIATGQPSVNVTITGTQVSGSGFYDPGTAGFVPAPNRITGTVSGGVVVNSATFNSPTSVTLNLDTTGVPAAAENVTITNPDGQSATGFGLLTVTGTPTDLIFKDGFESGSFSAWNSSTTDGGELSVTPGAALVGTKGMQALVDDTNGIFVEDDSPIGENRYRARFYFDPNGFDPGEGSGHSRTRILIAFDGLGQRAITIVLRRLSGAYSVKARVRLDDGTRADTAFVPISDGPHPIELDWKRASNPGATDGFLELFIDGSSVDTVSGLDNNASAIDFVRLGMLAVKSGATGTPFFDEFESRRISFIGL